MTRQEMRMVLRAIKGDRDAIDELERLVDHDPRWSRWPKVKMAANAGLAVIVAVTGLAAAVKTVYSYWKE